MAYFVLFIALMVTASAFPVDEIERVKRSAQNPHGQMLITMANDLYAMGDANQDSELQLEEFTAAFNRMDTDGNEGVSPEEYRAHLATLPSLAAHPNAIQHISQALFRLADSDSNGVLTSSDIAAMHAKFDLNHDGIVTGEEYVAKWRTIQAKLAAQRPQ